MRLVSINCIEKGMILGKTLYNTNGDVLLARGIVLEEFYIEKIKKMNISSLYIDDEISKNIEVKDVIDNELRNKAVVSIKNMFIKSDRPQFGSHFQDINKLVEMIIEEILNNQECLLSIIDLKLFDEYTYYHSVNVAVLSIAMGIGLKLDNEHLKYLGMGAILHDFGKCFTNINILNKNGKLTDTEFDIIKKHPRDGYDFLREKLNLPSHSSMVILQHHEKWNGKGYPLGRSKEDINDLARIVSVADVYDALTSDRPY